MGKLFMQGTDAELMEDFATYTDGDTLIANLPVEVDLELHDAVTRVVTQSLPPLRTVLLDCAAMRNVTPPGAAALAQLGDIAARQDTRVLLLDPDDKLRPALQTILPRAEMIHSHHEPAAGRI